MSEKKPASRPAVKKAATVRRVAPKATPRPKAKPLDGAAVLTAELRAIYQKATEEAEKQPPSGWSPEALRECIGTMSHEHAEVFREVLRWLRAEDEQDE
jgi:hypothetical protein